MKANEIRKMLAQHNAQAKNDTLDKYERMRSFAIRVEEHCKRAVTQATKFLGCQSAGVDMTTEVRMRDTRK